MWDSDTVIIDRINLTEKKKILTDNVMINFDIPSKGIAIMFDDSDYPGHFNSLWSDSQGLHMNIKTEIEEISPNHILELMESKDYSNFVWLSKRICIGSELNFVWILAHELQHMAQDLKSNFISKAGFFLTNTLGLIEIEEPPARTTVPYELDAEITAWRIAREVFGVEVADAYIKNNATAADKPDYYKITLNHNPDQMYDVVGNTIRLLRKYQLELEKIQQKKDLDKSLRNFDIDSVCLELSKI